jgi:hypothetical protein
MGGSFLNSAFFHDRRRVHIVSNDSDCYITCINEHFKITVTRFNHSNSNTRVMCQVDEITLYLIN